MPAGAGRGGGVLQEGAEVRAASNRSLLDLSTVSFTDKALPAPKEIKEEDRGEGEGGGVECRSPARLLAPPNPQNQPPPPYK